MADPRARKKNDKDSLGMLGDWKPPKYDGSLDGMAKLLKEPGETIVDARARVIELLRGEEDMQKFVDTFDRIRRKDPGRNASFDQVAEQSGCNRSNVYGAISRVLHRYSFDTTRTVIALVAAQQAGRVAMAMANRAANPEGVADRRLFMEVAGSTTRGGGGITVTVPVNASANAQAGAKAESVSVDEGPRPLPAFEDGVKELSGALRALPTVAKAG